MRGLEARESRRSLAITIKPRVGDAWPVEAVLHERTRTLPVVITGSFKIDEVELRGLVDPREYGGKLGRALFHGPVRDVFVRSVGGKDPLHVLLSIDPPELRPLLWERLCGPRGDGFEFLGLDQRVAYSRHIPSPTAREHREVRRGELRALILVACPDGLAEYRLAPFDVAAAADAARDGLKGVRCDLLGAVPGASGPATLAALAQALTRTAYAILHVVAHGRTLPGERKTLLFLEQDDRRVDTVEKHELIDRLALVSTLPQLMFFAACESGSDAGQDSMGGLARGLVGDLGVPAVVAMSSRVAVAAANTLTRLFYARLQVHGHVDEALVEACGGLAGRADALVPALYSRLGALPLFVPDPVVPRPGEPEPEWSDPDLREWAMTLQKAYAMRERLAGAGQSTDSIDTDISQVRLRLRKDGDLHAGDMLARGRYLLIGLMGEGLSASVWKAHDRQDNRLVAIKALHPQLLRSDGVVRQFKRGAERMQTLDHPNIARVFGPAQEEDQRLYVVMDLLPGGSLLEAVRRRRLPAAHILPIVTALGAGLTYAHGRRILHRDVEPSNILFDADGVAKLADFDLAVEQDRILETGLSHASPAVYVAPECLSEKPEAGPETDVYGLAMTALFMWAGAPPVGALRNPRRFLAGLPIAPQVRRALRRAVSFTPRRRFPTVAAFVAALNAPADPWWRRPASLALLAALVLGVVVVVAVLRA